MCFTSERERFFLCEHTFLCDCVLRDDKPKRDDEPWNLIIRHTTVNCPPDPLSGECEMSHSHLAVGKASFLLVPPLLGPAL